MASSTLKDAFISKYPKNKNVLGYFEKANGVECTWENLTKVRLKHFVDYMFTSGIAKNSVRTFCAKFKSVLTAYNEEVTLPKDYDKILQIRRDASQHTYLTPSDIEKLRRYIPLTEKEKVVKNRFLLGCVTGARHSDYEKFTQNNISGGELKYLSIKTHTDTSVPLSPLTIALITENEEKGYNNIVISDSYFNRALRKMCRAAGICDKETLYNYGKFRTEEKWKFVSSHTARRSFATNLYKAGVDIYTISRLCGHSSIEMTRKYICCAVNIDDSVKAFFDSIK